MTPHACTLARPCFLGLLLGHLILFSGEDLNKPSSDACRRYL
jgi:hypothetical protein